MRGNNLSHRALTKGIFDTFTNELRQSAIGTTFQAAKAYVEIFGIGNPPFDEGIDDNVLFLACEHSFRFDIKGQQALVKLDDSVNQRQFEMQARIKFGVSYFAKAKLDRLLTFINGKEHRAEQ